MRGTLIGRSQSRIPGLPSSASIYTRTRGLHPRLASFQPECASSTHSLPARSLHGLSGGPSPLVRSSGKHGPPRMSSWGLAPSPTPRLRFTSSLIGHAGPINPKSYATYTIDPTHPPVATDADDIPDRISDRFWKDIQEAETSIIYEKLEAFATRGYIKPTESLVKYLLTERNQVPNARLYGALIHVNIDPMHGSAGSVRSILEEMADEGIEPDPKICSSVLAVVAVHTDHLLRDEVLSYMGEKCIQLTQANYQNVIAGYIREGQHAVALEKIEEMIDKRGLPAPVWLHTLLLYSLLNAGELEEVVSQIEYADRTATNALQTASENSFRAVNQPAAGVLTISPVLWHRVLDVCSSSYFHTGTKLAWSRAVASGLVNPPTGVCLKVLETAARAGDPELATDVLRVLGNRRHRFTAHHYEPVIDAYINQGDLQNAFAVLSAMSQAGIEPGPSSTRSIYQYLKADPTRPAEAFKHLIDLSNSLGPSTSCEQLKAEEDDDREGGKDKEIEMEGDEEPVESGAAVPVASVNVVLEACAHLGDLTGALSHYTRLRDVCHTGPTTETFNILFRACRIAKRPDVATFLVSEMVAIPVRPNDITYDRLMLVSLDTAKSKQHQHQPEAAAEDHRMALEYLELMVEHQLQARRGTIRLLFTDLVNAATAQLERAQPDGERAENEGEQEEEEERARQVIAAAAEWELVRARASPEARRDLAKGPADAVKNLARFWTTADEHLLDLRGFLVESVRLCEQPEHSRLLALIPARTREIADQIKAAMESG